MKKFRMQWTALVAVVTFVVVGILQPQQIGVLLLKLNILAMAGWVGYWMDRELFPYGRPHESGGHEREAAMIRRALIVGSAMIAAGIAL